MLCKRASLSIGNLLGNLEGGFVAGTFERKEKYVWVPFFDPKVIRILSLVAIWNFSKGTGLSSVDIRLWGTKDPSIRPGRIGTVRARNQC